MTVLGFFLPLVHNKIVSLVTVPIFSGLIGYATNWTGVWMLFYPVRFAGMRLPGLARLAGLLPRKIQQIPGIMQGGVGWQGIIPSRAAKMGSIAVDKGIAKVGGPSDFYEQLPEVVHEVTDEIGNNIDQLLDIKLMVIRHLEAHPGLANRIFQETGRQELRFIINFGFIFGFVLGIPTAAVVHVLPYWWVLPIMGTLVGWATNWLAIRMIFEPVEPRRVGPWTWQGLFLKRQKEAADVYAEVIANDIVTIRNIGHELLHGPRADRTREMIAAALRPAVDRATGPARAAVRVAVGSREYDNIREQVALEGVEYTMSPLTDEDFNERQSVAVRELISERMREMDPTDFSEMLRSAMREDEWLLILHGAVLGFGAGLVHYALFGV